MNWVRVIEKAHPFRLSEARTLEIMKAVAMTRSTGISGQACRDAVLSDRAQRAPVDTGMSLTTVPPYRASGTLGFRFLMITRWSAGFV
jgi:hypothetical protein